MQEIKKKLIKSGWLLVGAIALTALVAFGGVYLLAQFPQGENGIGLAVILILVVYTFPLAGGFLALQIILSLIAIKWSIHFFLGIVNLLEGIAALMFYGWLAAACFHDFILLAVIFILGMVCILLAAIALIRTMLAYRKAKKSKLIKGR
ncbi:MAG: hypothetical protein IKC91_00815 [Clostridia bacterium]|nr:hypothetical protein [Clostridia bacterium]